MLLDNSSILAFWFLFLHPFSLTLTLGKKDRLESGNCSGGVRPAESEGQGASLYPWGLLNGDYQLSPVPHLETLELQGSAEVRLTLGNFTIFRTSHITLYVNKQGHISFVPGFEYLQIKSHGTTFGSKLVIPFLGEVDMVSPHRGSVYYRESRDKTLLQMATKDVKMAFPSLKHLNLNWIFVASWIDMAFFEPTFYHSGSTCSCKSRRNSFQAILTTDGVHSFVIFNYNKLTWSRSPWSWSSKIAKIANKYHYFSYFNSSIAGFDYDFRHSFTQDSENSDPDDPISRYTLPGSFTEQITNLTRRSNTDHPGKWIFRVDSDLQSTNCDYFDKVEKIRAYPSYIPYLGAIPFKIRGPCLLNTTNIECRFYDVLSPSKTNLTTIIVTKGVVSDTGTFVKCESPLLFTSSGRVKLELGFVHEFIRPGATTEEKGMLTKETKTFIGYIYTYVPPTYSETSMSGLDLTISENGDVHFKWHPEFWTGSQELKTVLLELNLVELDWSSPDLRRVEKGPLKMTVFNSGFYTWALGTAGIFKNPTSGYFAYVKAIGENYGEFRGRHIYSGIVYTNFSKTSKEYSQVCLEALQRNSGSAENLFVCPPLFSQAWIDWNFQYDWNSTPDKLQFRQRVPNVIGQGQRCVYEKSGRLMTSPPDAGWPDMSSPKGIGGMVGHNIKDILPFNLCCKFSQSVDTCAKFYDKRPISTGAGYVAPVLGMWRGNGHITTFDNASYTFNGVGEFWMIKSNDSKFSNQLVGKNGKFEMQARLSRLVIVNKGSIKEYNTSIFTALAIKSGGVVVQVELVQTGLKVWLDKIEVDLIDWELNKLGRPVTLTKDGVSIAIFSIKGAGDSEINRVVLAFQSEFTLDVAPVDGLALNVVVSVSPKLKTKSGFSGLLGNFDGNPGNDFSERKGVQLVEVGESLESIHNQFGIKWRTMEGESLFFYSGGKAQTSFQDITFTPHFIDPNISSIPKAVVEMCGRSRECLFDYYTTGSLSIANGTKEMENRIVFMRDVFKRKLCLNGYPCPGKDVGFTFTVPTPMPTYKGGSIIVSTKMPTSGVTTLNLHTETLAYWSLLCTHILDDIWVR